jgi:hypothetical protein
MPILELPPNPARLREQNGEPSGDSPAASAIQPIKVRTGRFGELAEHELVHLLDSIDDELSRARFRESIYISTIVCLAIAWFLFYGPRILFHQPEYKDLVSAMKERDREITLSMPHVAPHPPARAVPDKKTLQQLQQSRPTPPAPPTPTPQAPPPQEEAHTTAPPVAQPALPLPSAPRPQQPMVDAPAPHTNSAQSSPNDALQGLIRGARGPGSPGYGPAPGSARGPLQAGADILSDTMGVDFTAYMRRLTRDIKRNWEPLIPEEVQAPLMKKGIVGIRFSILPDGSIGQPMVLETRSGDVALDKAAWYAITSQPGGYEPLPKEFHGPRLELRLGFYYNLEPPH